MRWFTPPLLLGSLGVALACGGAADTKTVEVPVVEAPVGPAVWELTQQDGQDLVKAGTTQNVTVGTQMVLLGPPLAGTENRQIVGSGVVAEVWPDLSRVTAERMRKEGPAPSAARLYLPEDQAALDLLAPVGGKGGSRPAAASASTAAAPASGEFTIDQVPASLKSGTAESRMDALVRYETDASMTQAIIWVLKNDAHADVQFKAWRVVRARWKRGTGSAADHEAAAGWVAGRGSDDARVEALGELGDRSRSLTVPAKYLADPLQSVRVAAAKAVFDIGGRSGKRADAKKLLQDRREVEPVVGVRKKLGDWIDAL